MCTLISAEGKDVVLRWQVWLLRNAWSIVLGITQQNHRQTPVTDLISVRVTGLMFGSGSGS